MAFPLFFPAQRVYRSIGNAHCVIIFATSLLFNNTRGYCFAQSTAFTRAPAMPVRFLPLRAVVHQTAAETKQWFLCPLQK